MFFHIWEAVFVLFQGVFLFFDDALFGGGNVVKGKRKGNFCSITYPYTNLYLSASSLSALPEVFLDPLFPAVLDLHTHAHRAHHVADGRVVQSSALLVAVIVSRPLWRDTKALGLCRRVDVGSQEEKFPAVLLLLAEDHIPHPVIIISAAGVLHAVGGDHKERLFRNILPPDIFIGMSLIIELNIY